MKLRSILLLGLLLACSSAKEGHKAKPSIREEIFGREFSNSEVVSVEILEMEHPLLGPVLSTRKLTKEQEVRFLKDFDSLEKQGLRKCFTKYIVRLNFASDTLRLKVCGDMVSNRSDDVYYKLPNERNIIQDLLN